MGHPVRTAAFNMLQLYKYTIQTMCFEECYFLFALVEYQNNSPAEPVQALSLCLSRVISDQNIHRQPIQSQSDGSLGEESSYAAMLLMIMLSLALCHSLLLLGLGLPSHSRFTNFDDLEALLQSFLKLLI